jgi:hypothetical protein
MVFDPGLAPIQDRVDGAVPAFEKPLPPANIVGQRARVVEVDKRAKVLVAQGTGRRARDDIQAVDDSKRMRPEREIEVACERAVAGPRLTERVQPRNLAPSLTPASDGQGGQGGPQAVSRDPQAPPPLVLKATNLLVQQLPQTTQGVVESFMHAPTQRAGDEIAVQVRKPVFKTIRFGPPETDEDRLRIGGHKTLRGLDIEEAEVREFPRRGHHSFDDLGIRIGQFGCGRQLQGGREIEIVSRADAPRCWHR